MGTEDITRVAIYWKSDTAGAQGVVRTLHINGYLQDIATYAVKETLKAVQDAGVTDARLMTGAEVTDYLERNEAADATGIGKDE